MELYGTTKAALDRITSGLGGDLDSQYSASTDRGYCKNYS
jgi:hypothetical protein